MGQATDPGPSPELGKADTRSGEGPGSVACRTRHLSRFSAGPENLHGARSAHRIQRRVRHRSRPPFRRTSVPPSVIVSRPWQDCSGAIPCRPFLPPIEPIKKAPMAPYSSSCGVAALKLQVGLLVRLTARNRLTPNPFRHFLRLPHLPQLNNLPRWPGGAGGVRPRPPGKFRRVHVAGVAGGVHPRATSAKPLDGPETTSDAAVRQTKFHQLMNDLSSPSADRRYAGTWNCSIDHATSARTSERSKSPRRATR